MKSSLVLIASPLLLLLLLFLLLGSVSTLPLVDPSTHLDLQDLILNTQDKELSLYVDPDVQVIPVVLELDPDLSLELEEESTGGRSVEVGGHTRRRRQTTVSGGVNTERLGQGGRRDHGHINIGHTAGKHTVTGGFKIDKVRIPGVGKDKNVGVNVGYAFKPNKNTAFSIAASHARGGSGRSSSFGVNFSHTFGNGKK